MMLQILHFAFSHFMPVDVTAYLNFNFMRMFFIS